MASPIVVEIAGMPKTGKDRLIRSIYYHFRRQDYRVRILDESSRRCPFDKAHHFEYTAWGMFSIMQRILEETFAARFDLILVNRGPYDAEVLAEMVYRKGDTSERDANALKVVSSLKTFRDKIDLLVVCMCSPSESLTRERKDRVEYSEGRIMNPDVLGLLYEIYNNCLESWKSCSKEMILIDTEQVEFLDRVRLVASRISKHLQAVVLPRIVGSRDELACIVRRLAEEEKQVTMVKGCFDMLHAGHIDFLSRASQLGDILCVLLFDDSSVYQRKGEGRPRMSSTERAKTLLQLRCVDLVAVISEEDLKELPGNLPVSAVATTRDAWEGTEYGNVVRLKRTESISTTEIVASRSSFLQDEIGGPGDL